MSLNGLMPRSKTEMIKKCFTRRRIIRFVLKSLRNVGIGALTFLILWAFHSRNLPDLESWHEPLEGEFTKANAKEGFTLDDYLAIESELFQKMEAHIMTRPDSEEDSWVPNRYSAGSPSDPRGLGERNWNRTQLLPAMGTANSGALLIHGLTDSPYSMKGLAETFQKDGALVLCLRMPGHGTVPGALTKARWHDWLAAVRVGLQHLKTSLPDDSPIYLVGYSNGGALALKHTLDAVEDDSYIMPKKVFLLNPAIGVTRLASLSHTHKPLSWMPWFKKFKWVEVLPEYDPFKYNSFPKYGAEQSYKLSQRLISQLARLEKASAMEQLPPIITFQSALDATVSVKAVVECLYKPIQNETSELFFYDINRFSPLAPFINSADASLIPELSQRGDLPYQLSILTNTSSESQELSLKTKPAKTLEMSSHEVDLAWPDTVYSLSHVAVPFRPDDPLYGLSEDATDGLSLRLGATMPRGERGGLSLSIDNLMRLRANPFFRVMEERVQWHLRN